RSELRHDVDAGVALSDQPSTRTSGHDDRRPVAIVVAWFEPALGLVAGIDRLAVQEIVGDERSWVRPPRSIGGNDDPAAVADLHPELGEQRRVVAVLLRSERGDLAGVPAAPEAGGQHVLAAAQEVPDSERPDLD